MSAIKGKPQQGDTIGFEASSVERDDQQTVNGLICPQGQAVELRPRKKPASYSGGFDAEVCAVSVRRSMSGPSFEQATGARAPICRHDDPCSATTAGTRWKRNGNRESTRIDR